MKNGRHPLSRWILRIGLGSAFVSGIALLLMMVAGAADVVGTNLDIIGLRSRPIPAAFEFMATTMVVTVFLAMALAQAQRRHIRVEVLLNLLPSPVRRILDVTAHFLTAVMWSLIAWYGWKSGFHSFSVGEYAPGLINFPVWPARLVLGFGATLMTCQSALDALGVYLPAFRTVDDDGERQSAPIS